MGEHRNTAGVTSLVTAVSLLLKRLAPCMVSKLTCMNR